jgi:predicted Zn-dependent protease
MAEHYYERGQLNNAIHHMRLALNEPGDDFYETSRMQARLEQFQGERRERLQQ